MQKSFPLKSEAYIEAQVMHALVIYEEVYWSKDV